MRKPNYLILLLLKILFIPILCQTPTIMPKFTGRFGDKLTCIYTTLRFSYKYNLIFKCPEFEYSNLLKIHDEVPKITKENMELFKNIILVNDETVLIENKLLNNTIYQIPLILSFRYHKFDKNINKRALEKFKQIISLKIPIKLPMKLSKNNINVAVHVRKGGGYDKPLLSRFNQNSTYIDVLWPKKFPPDSFYIEQIKNLFTILKKQKMHVHIFTDDENPETILNKYKKSINEPLINFSCRKNNNNYKDNTIEDFFYMSKFEYLICPESSFSKMAQLIGNFKIVIMPKQATWIKKDKLIIDKVLIIKK